MVDPFSIVGAIGTAAGLLGFVVGTIEKTITTGSTMRHARHLRNDLQLSLETCEHRFELWLAAWYPLRDMPSAEQTTRQQMIWGKTGHDRIQSRVDAIAIQAQRAIDLLYGSAWHSGLSRAEQIRWKELLDSHTAPWQRSTMLAHVPGDDMSLSLYRRVATALGDGSLLKSCISDLRTAIEDLRHESLWHWRKRHRNGDQVSEPSEDQLAATAICNERAERLLRSMSGFYEAVRVDSHKDWALLFRNFEQPAACQLECGEHLELDFLTHERGLKDGGICTRLVAKYHLDLDEEIELDEQTRTDSGLLRDTLRNAFCQIIAAQPNLQIKYRTKTKPERMSAALSIASWATLIGSSEWVMGLCSCNIRHVQFPQTAERVPMFSGRPCLLSWFGHECYAQNFRDRPYLLLTVLLAELALAQPIFVDENESSPFLLQQGTTDELRIGPVELIKKVYRATSHDYQKAVRYCLQCDKQVLGETETPGSDIALYTKMIIRPLHAHYERIRAFERRHPRLF
jgi:hypothetical protein